MSDEVRIAREMISQLLAKSTAYGAAATSYDVQVVQMMMILNELCSAVENLEKTQSYTAGFLKTRGYRGVGGDDPDDLWYWEPGMETPELKSSRVD